LARIDLEGIGIKCRRWKNQWEYSMAKKHTKLAKKHVHFWEVKKEHGSEADRGGSMWKKDLKCTFGNENGSRKRRIDRCAWH
jgi:hypothetical protein